MSRPLLVSSGVGALQEVLRRFRRKGGSARFRGKWGLGGPPPPPPAPSPNPPLSPGGRWGFYCKSQGGGVFPGEGGGEGQRCVRGIFLGGGRVRRGPNYRENEPRFRRKRLSFASWPKNIFCLILVYFIRASTSCGLSNVRLFKKNYLAWLPLQSLAVKKNFFLCKFWAVKNF